MTDHQTTRQVTAGDLLLAGWHRLSEPDGVWWAYPFYWMRRYSFQDARKLYLAGARDE